MHYMHEFRSGSQAATTGGELQTFLEVTCELNVAAAAERLKLDVTTIRRRPAALQAATEFELLIERGRTLQPTNDGQRDVVDLAEVISLCIAIGIGRFAPKIVRRLGFR